MRNLSTLETRLKTVLNQYLSPIIADTVYASRVSASGINLRKMRIGDRQRLLLALKKGIGRYLKEEQAKQCMTQLELAMNVTTVSNTPAPAYDEQAIPIRSEVDIVVARSAGRQMCQTLGFSSLLQIKMATAISELARNIVQYAGEGKISLKASEEDGRSYLEVVAMDDGPGIPHLDEILSGTYRSRTGMGKGLTGTRNMVDNFDIKSGPGSGTRVVIRKWV
jgi:serine/threonine-protein kinase RsbT